MICCQGFGEFLGALYGAPLEYPAKGRRRLQETLSGNTNRMTLCTLFLSNAASSFDKCLVPLFCAAKHQ